jgi:hypothetical protein
MMTTRRHSFLAGFLLICTALILGVPEMGHAQGQTKLVADAATIRTPQGNIEDFWNAFEWSELTATEQAAWAKLGWNQNNWGGHAPPPASEAKNWQALTPDEQTAATQLGYNSTSWNATAPTQ